MTIIIPGLYGLDSATAWRVLQKDPKKYMDRFSKDPRVQREIEYFQKKAPDVKSIDDLMKDRRLLQFVLDAHGLGAEINNAGRIKKILSENPNDTGALVNRLADPRFKQFAQSLRLDRDMNSFELKIRRDSLVDGYIRNRFEETLGEQDNALRQTAYFARNISTVKDAYGILGDRVLRDVFSTAFNLPPQLAVQPVETQAAAVSRRLDLPKLTGISSTITPSQIDRAQQDYTLLESSLKVSDAAVAQIRALSDQLLQLGSDYANLATVTDPGGENAALIAVQEAAVPELVRAEQLLRGGASAYQKIGGYLNSLEDLTNQISQPGADLAALKSQFNAYAGFITDALNAAAVQVPDGSTQNILQNGANDTVTVIIDDAGTEYTFSRHDISDVQNMIATAQTAFDNISGSGDTANIVTAQSRILISKDRMNAIGETMAADILSLNEVGASYFAAATLNSESLLDGKRSVDDSLNRIAQIEEKLGRIGELATESRNRSSLESRADLENEFNALRSEIRDLIENASDSGLDNFLNNIADQSYEIINGQTILVQGGYDLATAISDVLDAASLSTQGDAAALEIAAIQVTTASDAAKEGLNREKPILDKIIGTYDPKGSLDSQIYALKQQLTAAVTAATVEGKNLLSADQTDIKLGALSTGKDITFRAQSGFEADVSAAITDLLAEMGNGSAAIISALDDVAYLVDSAKRRLEADNRSATLELGKLAGTIDILNGNRETDSENPYKVNAYTEKFLIRYLTQVQLSGGGASSINSPISLLFNDAGGGYNAQSAMANLMSLSLQI